MRVSESVKESMHIWYDFYFDVLVPQNFKFSVEIFWYTHTGKFEIDHYEYDQELQQNTFIHAKAYFPVFSRRFRQ